MKMNRLFLSLAACALAFAFLSPPVSLGDPAPEKNLAEVATAVIAQQKIIAENQSKIDTKLAEIAEELRLARIYISRGR